MGAGGAGDPRACPRDRVCLYSGPATLVERQLGASKCSWASETSAGQHRGPKWRLHVHIRYSAAMRLVHPGKASPTLLWELRSHVICSPDVDLVPRSKTFTSACHCPTTVRTGTGRGLSSLSLQQLLSSTPALNNVCVFGGGRLNHILAPPLQRRQQGPETQFPLRLLLPRCPFTTQGSLHPKSFHQVTGDYSSGLFWTLPKMTWKELTLPWSAEHTGWLEPCLTEAVAGETAKGLHLELKDWSQHSRGGQDP